MRKLLILGAGTAGTMMANKMRRALDDEWQITIIDEDPFHYYQPGFLFIPFGTYQPMEVKRPKADFLPVGVRFVQSAVDVIEPDKKRVRLSEHGTYLSYDLLIIATGTEIRPGEVEGLDGEGWGRDIFDFYTLEGAAALARHLRHWEGGRLVLNVAEMPIKCPVAPLEFLFLADWHFHTRGIRDKVELVYATPLDGAFTKPRASALLGELLERKNIHVETEFDIGQVDPERKIISSYEDKEIPYDLLVIIPPNLGSDTIERSGMGNESNYIPTDKHSLRALNHEDIFVIGDATNLPSSKAGSVAHFQAEVLTENILRHIEGQELLPAFDGHANCFIESGFGQALLIDFNYDTEPLPGKFPLPGVGPFSLLAESRMNHWGKMMFRWIYWNQLIRGAELPLEAQMVMAGKKAA
ncbi:MAG: FAD-dependent oxidoreductase [Deltaproteobacteria bacterium]|nr:FAD-dependent oxidoreductase [Deltaproteobacteria bacterium]MBW2530680.1 FAD-dependent oxidoreductase [Deltaproteobacteria bacterium]